MKILIVHHQMTLYGGAEVVVVRLAKHFQSHGHEVGILAASSAPNPVYEGLNIITPPNQASWHLWDGAISSLLEINDVLTHLHKMCKHLIREYDALNVHNFPCIWAVPKTDKRVVWMCNEIPELWHRETLPMWLS